MHASGSFQTFHTRRKDTHEHAQPSTRAARARAATRGGRAHNYQLLRMDVT